MRTKQVRPEKTEYEFELYLSKRVHSVTRKEYLLFDFRTVKIFENFNYQITVEPKINIAENLFEFNIEGLSAPVVALSKDGFADFKYRLYEIPNGDYTLKIIKQRKESYLYKLKISKAGIKITKKSPKKFINIIVQTQKYVSQTI